MSWYLKTNTDGNPNDLMTPVAGNNNCCDTNQQTLKTYRNTAFDITADPIDGITIDGTEYSISPEADTLAKLYDGVNSAMEAAGYADIVDRGTEISGADATAVITVITSATLTVLNQSDGGTTALSEV